MLLYGNVRFRREIGLALAVYLVGVFPANVYVAVKGIDVEGQPDGPYPWIRLPLQAAFVLIAWWSTRDSEADRLHQASPAQLGEARSATFSR